MGYHIKKGTRRRSEDEVIYQHEVALAVQDGYATRNQIMELVETGASSLRVSNPRGQGQRRRIPDPTSLFHDDQEDDDDFLEENEEFESITHEEHFIEIDLVNGIARANSPEPDEQRNLSLGDNKVPCEHRKPTGGVRVKLDDIGGTGRNLKVTFDVQSGKAGDLG